MSSRRWRRFHPVGSLFWISVLVSTQGCASLADKGQLWMWGVIPLLGFLLIGGSAVLVARRRQLLRWRIDKNHADPGVSKISWGLIIVGAVITVGFLVLNLQAPADPNQKLWNVGVWAASSLFGGAGAMLIGLLLAEPRKLNR